MAEKFPNLEKETDIQVKKAQRVPNNMAPRRSTLRHITIKMSEVKERILKATIEKHHPNTKTRQRCHKKGNYRPISLINIEARILTKY